VVKPSHRREMAQRANKDFSVAIRISCDAFGISETCYRGMRIAQGASLRIVKLDPAIT